MGKLRQFFSDFFEESEEGIMDEIVDEGKNINELNKKLKKLKEMKKGLLKKFFSESEDELREDIKESEKRIKELKERLFEIKKKNGEERKKKKRKLGKKKRKEVIRKTSKLLFILVITIVLFILVYNGVMWGIEKYKNRPFRYVCRAENPCRDCKVAVSCVQFEEVEEGKDFMYFSVRNKNNKVGDCYVNIMVEKEGLLLVNRTYSLGEIDSEEKVAKKVEMSLPGGDVDLMVIPDCVWE
jgi:hypothetical protein